MQVSAKLNSNIPSENEAFLRMVFIHIDSGMLNDRSQIEGTQTKIN